jgi:hypothetical protein
MRPAASRGELAWAIDASLIELTAEKQLGADGAIISDAEELGPRSSHDTRTETGFK